MSDQRANEGSMLSYAVAEAPVWLGYAEEKELFGSGIAFILEEYVNGSPATRQTSFWYHVVCANEEIAGVIASAGLAEHRVPGGQGYPTFYYTSTREEIIELLDKVGKKSIQISLTVIPKVFSN